MQGHGPALSRSRLRLRGGAFGGEDLRSGSEFGGELQTGTSHDVADGVSHVVEHGAQLSVLHLQPLGAPRKRTASTTSARTSLGIVMTPPAA